MNPIRYNNQKGKAKFAVQEANLAKFFGEWVEQY